MAAISEGEAAVYDRQLRLWGVQAQTRLMSSKVLVWGLEGSLVEVSKNLVLAGVSVTIRDHRIVEKSDVEFNYFLRAEDAGKNRGACAAERLQEMNPLNTVTAISEKAPVSSSSEAAEVVKGFDVVCVGASVLGYSVAMLRAINEACRKSSTCFFLSLGAGDSAFFFSDLQEHIVEERSSVQGGAEKAEAPAEAKEVEKVSFPSLAAWLDCPVEELQREKVDHSMLFFWMVMQFFATKAEATSGDAAAFIEFSKGRAEWVPETTLASWQSAFRLFFLEPLIPVASILGGLLAQDVIKAITKKDPPLVNSICFSAQANAAYVERIPSGKDLMASKKRKAEEVCLDLD